MEAKLKYCDNADAETPTMFIDKQIGDTTDENGKVISKGIDGDEFMKELLYLSDVLNKKTIEVWINSEGGLVKKGQSIYQGILASKADVNTVCYGIAASIAGVIFQAGKKRIMTDFANLMYHPAYNPDGTRDKGLDAMNDAVIKMISSRTGKSEEDTWKMMNAGGKSDKGTWLNANDALKNGMCDEIKHSANSNSKTFKDATTIAAKWEAANRILNRVNEPTKINTMKQVCNKLGLVEDSNETSILSAIEAMNKKNASEITTLENALKKKTEEADAANKSATELQNALNVFKKAKADADEEAAAKAVVDIANKAETELTNAVAVGKIKNDAAIIASWKNLFTKDFDGTKALIDAMNANKKAPTFTATGNEKPVYNAARINHEMSIKNKTK